MTININLTKIIIAVIIIAFLYVMGNTAIDFFNGLDAVVDARTAIPAETTPQP